MRPGVVGTGLRAAFLGVFAGTAASWADVTGPEALDALRAAYPGVQAHVHEGRVQAIYGRAMNGAANPDAAAAAWIAQHGGALGAGALDLRVEWAADLNFGRSTVFTFAQYIGGLPVEQGFAKVLVSNGNVDEVVYVGGRLAQAPQEGFGDAVLDGRDAIARVQASPAYADLGSWTAPQMVVYYGEGDIIGGIAPVRAWKFSGSAPGMAGPRDFTFFVDAATGALLFARSNIHHTDVSGTIQGVATTGLKPIGVNPSALTPLQDARATIQGGNNAFTDAGGAFTVPHAGTSPVTVNSNLQGRWVNVIDSVGAEITASVAGVTPPGPANLVFNSPEVALNTAQVNGFVHTTKTHNFFKERAPSYTRLDVVITCNVNLAQTCNAFYQSSNQSINFFQAGGGCSNTSYSTVISHEYGHFIVNRLGLAQGAFGEGYGDSVGMLIYDTPIVGENFQGSSPVRSPGITIRAYPCSGTEVHFCGEILAGVWYRIRQNLGNAHGSQVGLMEAQQLLIDWSLITAGGQGVNSAHPQTAIEVLTVDDDDNNLANGTPNYTQICAAFGTHSISCPQVSLLAFTYPNGRPTTIVEGQPTQVRVDVTGVSATPVPNTGKIYFRVNGGAYTQANMAQGAPNQYTATIPAQACPAVVDYYFEAQSSSGAARDPANAPTSAFATAITLDPGATLADEAFEAGNGGFVSGAPGDNATTGRWNRMDPQQTSNAGQTVQPEDDHTPSPGVNCWVTDGNAGTGVGSFDVDNGRTTLLSPVFDLSGVADAKVSYWRWYSNGSNGTADDTFRVDITNNGTTWVNVETLGPTGPGTTGTWLFKEFNVAGRVAPTANVQLRFIAEDIGGGSLVEAAIDDLKVVAQDCPQTQCYADCDTGTGPGVLDIFDFLCFQNRFAVNDPYACNCDVSTGQNVCDVFDFLCFQNAFAAGCP